MTKDDQLRAKLIEDTGSAEEAERLLPAARRLSTWSVPVPTAVETERLVAALSAVLPARQPDRSWLRWWRLLLAQRRVVQQEIWLASALVMALGLLVTLANQDIRSVEALPLVLIAPLVAALGIAFLYGPSAEPAWEIERATPIVPRLLVVMRLLWVFAFDLVFGLIGSLVLVFTQSGWSLWPLVSLWLAPMTCLASLAFLLSMIFVEPLIAATICLFLWGGQILREVLPFSVLPNWLAGNVQPWLWVLAAVCTGVALWLAGREERQLLKRI
jgi:hypothetical protein